MLHVGTPLIYGLWILSVGDVLALEGTFSVADGVYCVVNGVYCVFVALLAGASAMRMANLNWFRV